MRKAALAIGTIEIAFAIVVLVFADGARRWYSGLFFAIMGVVVLAYALARPRVAGG